MKPAATAILLLLTFSAIISTGKANIYKKFFTFSQSRTVPIKIILKNRFIIDHLLKNKPLSSLYNVKQFKFKHK